MYLEVLKDVYHAFLILEGKSNEGSPQEAINQACRAGAALVRAARLLREALGEADFQGADHRTFVFSATMSPGLMEIWAHWAEVSGETTTFHKAIDDEQHFGHLRRILHNILDWGCGARLDEQEPVHQAIVAYEQRQRVEAGTAEAARSAQTSDKRQRTG